MNLTDAEMRLIVDLLRARSAECHRGAGSNDERDACAVLAKKIESERDAARLLRVIRAEAGASVTRSEVRVGGTSYLKAMVFFDDPDKEPDEDTAPLAWAWIRGERVDLPEGGEVRVTSSRHEGAWVRVTS